MQRQRQECAGQREYLFVLLYSFFFFVAGVKLRCSGSDKSASGSAIEADCKPASHLAPPTTSSTPAAPPPLPLPPAGQYLYLSASKPTVYVIYLSPPTAPPPLPLPPAGQYLYLSASKPTIYVSPPTAPLPLIYICVPPHRSLLYYICPPPHRTAAPSSRSRKSVVVLLYQ